MKKRKIRKVEKKNLKKKTKKKEGKVIKKGKNHCGLLLSSTVKCVWGNSDPPTRFNKKNHAEKHCSNKQYCKEKKLQN